MTAKMGLRKWAGTELLALFLFVAMLAFAGLAASRQFGVPGTPEGGTVGDDPRGDVHLEGSAVALYLSLWNRSDEITATDDFDELWRSVPGVRWSTDDK